MRISDWSSDVCSSDLSVALSRGLGGRELLARRPQDHAARGLLLSDHRRGWHRRAADRAYGGRRALALARRAVGERSRQPAGAHRERRREMVRSEEHTSELQSLMRISYAVFCLKKKNKTTQHIPYTKARRLQKRK